MGNDYEEKLTQVEAEKQQKLTETEQMYGGMLDDAKGYYQNQIDASKEWASTQQNLQQAQTDFTIEQIEQQKAQAQKDYTKEQSGAYADYKKESNRYGVGAEEMATAGLTATGYNESSRVQMYTAYQNRVAVAREVYNQAVLNYNNAIKEAKLQNNSVLAEIAYNALQQQLQLALEGFQYENSLLFALEDRKASIDDTYHSRYLDVLNQMNTENALAEQRRQYDQSYELSQKEYEEGVRQFEEQMKLAKAQEEESTRQFEEQMAFKKAEAEEEKRQFDTMYGESIIDNENVVTQTTSKSGATLNGQTTDVTKNTNAGYTTKTAQKANTDYVTESTQKASAAGATLNGQTTDVTKNTNAGYATTVTEKYEFGTPYYRGTYNQDKEVFGTFANGYQPKGISGHGKLSKTGETVKVTYTVKYGIKKGKETKVEQNIWIAEDGTRWVWDSEKNCYRED